MEIGVTASITLSKASENYKSNLENYGVDLYFENNELKADLKYSSKYTEVNFYKTKIDPTKPIIISATYCVPANLISKTIQKNERLIEVEENLNHELNYDFSKNQQYNIVFTDIDDWGIKIKINDIIEGEVVRIPKCYPVYKAGYKKHLKPLSRNLRKDSTQEEIILWSKIRKKQINYGRGSSWHHRLKRFQN